MTLSNTERVLVGGILAVLQFLQTEVSISHTLHIVIACVLVFAGTVGIIQNKSELPNREAGKIE